MSRYSGSNNVLSIHVQDAFNARSIPMAKIELNWKGPNFTTYFWTEESGDMIAYSPYTEAVKLTVYAEGYVPNTQIWEIAQSNEIVVELEKIIAIGGYVVDEAGQAVDRVTVGLNIPGVRNFISNDLGLHKETTDRMAFGFANMPRVI